MFSGSTEVTYSVRVPAGADVKFTTVNGGIEVTGLTGKIDAETTNGGITAREVSGSIEATTTNGGVDVELMQVARGGVTLGCTNGGIKLRLPADAAANISASVANGGIDADGLHLETTESTRRSLEGKMNGGGPPVRIEGTNGGTISDSQRCALSGELAIRAAARTAAVSRASSPRWSSASTADSPSDKASTARADGRGRRATGGQVPSMYASSTAGMDVALAADGLCVAEPLGHGLDRPHDVALRLRLRSERREVAQ